MGIDYQAAVMVGLERGNIEDENLLESIYEGDSELEVCAPYYDGGDDDSAIVGFCYAASDTYAPDEFVWNQEEIDKLKANFKAATGQDAKVWLSPMGW